MKNNFKENLNKKIISDISNGTIFGLQNQLSCEARNGMEDIYEAFKALDQGKSSSFLSKNFYHNIRLDNNFDYGLALNIFMQKFLMENKNEIENMRYNYIEKQRSELGIRETNNPNYYIDRNNNYYSFDYDKFIKENSIINVEEDGSYITKDAICNSEYYVIKKYTSKDLIKTLYVVDKHERKITKITDAIKLLRLKKEVVKRFKRVGYCGKSFDTCADLLNAFCKPSETGFYSDNKFNFYRWDYKNCQFIRQTREGNTPGAPNISDYEQKDSKTIVRTDYTGSGVQNFSQFNLQYT